MTYSSATKADIEVFRNRDLVFSFTSDSDITAYTVTATAESTDGVTSFAATVSKDIPTKTWTITWTNTQTAAMTNDVYLYEMVLSTGTTETQAFYGSFLMQSVLS